ncbi:aminotransferase class V-fold PLP-dependent enzyme [Longispora urticae]
MMCTCRAHTALYGPADDEKPGPFNVTVVRDDFPLLRSRSTGTTPLAYLDSAATSQKPTVVLDAEYDYNAHHNANVHRGSHALAREATELFERSRDVVADLIGADRDEVVFTRNATEALNLLAYAIGNASTADRPFRSLAIGPGDTIVVTEMEHHSNLMPWQELCRRTGATLRWLPLTDDGRLDLSGLDEIVTERTKILTFTHQSNLYGTVNPVPTLVRRARQVGALTVLDACQSVPHMPVDVVALGVDFLAFSGHKACGPTGVGVLWGRKALLSALPPFMTGGEMNGEVTMARSSYAEPPRRFEAGTPMIAQAIGLAAACRYLSRIGLSRIAAHEHALTSRALSAMAAVPGLRIIGPSDTFMRGPALSFALEGLNPAAVGTHLNERGIAIRVGNLCAQPACGRFALAATTRASFHLYTSTEEVDRFTDALAEIRCTDSVLTSG